jgi:hypothetical protein
MMGTGCKKVLGLNLQENYNYQQRTLDPNINMTAKQFLIARADGSTGAHRYCFQVDEKRIGLLRDGHG